MQALTSFTLSYICLPSVTPLLRSPPTEDHNHNPQRRSQPRADLRPFHSACLLRRRRLGGTRTNGFGSESTSDAFCLRCGLGGDRGRRRPRARRQGLDGEEGHGDCFCRRSIWQDGKNITNRKDGVR